MIEEPEVIESEEPGIYSRKDKIKYVLIYSSIFILMPTGIGIPLTAIFSNPYIIESSYVIFGAISIIFAFIRSTRRDTKNIRKNHTLVEDKETEEYRKYSFQQWVAYISGAVSLVLSIAAFYICDAIGLFAIQ